MSDDRPVVISGRFGRLGRALAATAPVAVAGWDQPELDLDDPEACAALVARERPRLVIHTAAMTDVEGAAREPELALQRNGLAVGAIARACREVGSDLVLISTNEVFDGEREGGRGYAEDDRTAPGNPYGVSKLAGESAARKAFDDGPGLCIVRTAWLFGPPGNDFPDKITAAADKVDGPLPVVADEFGSPTYARDLAHAIWELGSRVEGGTFHLVNSGVASRLEWARAVLEVRRPGRQLRSIGADAFERASDPPRWGILDTSRAAAAGVTMRPWREALTEYLHEAASSQP